MTSRTATAGDDRRRIDRGFGSHLLPGRRTLWVLGTTAAGLALIWLIYRLLGHGIVASAYRGESFDLLNQAIRGREVYSVDKYLFEADRLVARALAIGWRVLGVAGLAAVAARALDPWSRRRCVALAAVCLAAALGLAAVNRVRLDAAGLRQETARLLETNAAVVERARGFDGEAVLAELGDGSTFGEHLRFDRQLASAVGEDWAFAGSPGGADHRQLRADLGSVDFELGGTGANALTLHGGGEPRVSDGAIRYRASAESFLAAPPPLAFDPTAVDTLEVRMAISAGRRARVAFAAAADGGPDWGRCAASIDLRTGDELRTYKLKIDRLLAGCLEQGLGADRLFFQAADREARVTIESLRLVGKLERYTRRPHGVRYERVRDEVRPAIYLPTNYRLSWTVDVPRDEPKLDFGLARVVERQPIDVELIARREVGGESTLYAGRLDGDGWVDAATDLSPLAGETVTVTLRTRSAGHNVVLWSSPILRGARQREFNVVVLLEDTLRADHLSSYGYAAETTPFKDAFFAEGARFAHVVSQATKTRPSVSTLMTAQYASTTGVWRGRDTLGDAYVTLAEVLREHGFATAAFVQNHNAGQDAGAHQGFDRLFDERALGPRADDVLGERLHGWLEKHSDRNVFLYLHLLDPHGPYDPPGASEEPPPEGGQPLPRLSEIDPDWIETPTAEVRVDFYDREIRHNDDVLERFLGELRNRAWTDDTLVVFVSDHGEFQGENWRWGHEPPGLYPGIHVPMMMRYPGRIPAGLEVDPTVQVIDIMPTVLDFAAIDRSPLLIQGRSLVPLLTGDAAPWRHVAVSEEVVQRSRADEGGFGSVFLDDWQVVRSNAFPSLRRFAGRSLPTALPDFDLATRVVPYRATGDGKLRTVNTYWLNGFLKADVNRFLRQLDEQNGEIRAVLSTDETAEEVVEPDVLDRLRALGYLN